MATTDGLVIAVLLLIVSEFITLIMALTSQKRITNLRRRVTSLEKDENFKKEGPIILKLQSKANFETLNRDELIEETTTIIDSLDRTDPKRMNLIRFKAIAVRSQDRNAFLQLKSYLKYIKGNFTEYIVEDNLTESIVKDYFDLNSTKDA